MRKGNEMRSFKITPASAIIWMALGYISAAQATIIPDKNQTQIPDVRANKNGSLTVNINPVSAAGISHNKYTRFDVPYQGVVLNNSDKESKTQLAGTIAGNRNLAAGQASLIINEVNSGQMSMLSGKIEIAGKKADVIIANPGGITCDGCGFINTGRSTLTTGTPKISNGALAGINVQKGQIIITNQGMSDSSDYTNLLAQSLKVSAMLKAEKELQIMTGTNSNITVSNGQLVNTRSTGSSSYYAGIDVQSLGGMYANRITLVSTDPYSTITNNGLISSDTNISMDTKGNITNHNTISSLNGDVRMTAAKSINNQKGKITSQKGDVRLTSGSYIYNQNGTIASDRDALIKAQGGINNYMAKIDAKEYLNLDSSALDNNSGYIFGNEVSIVANTLSNTNSSKYPSFPKDDRQGGIRAEKDVVINTSGNLDSQTGWITSNSNSVSLTSDTNIILNYADITAKEDIYLSSKTLDYPPPPKPPVKPNPPVKPWPDPIDAHLTAGNDINLEVENLGLFDAKTVLNAGHDINITPHGGRTAGKFLNYATLSAANNIVYKHGIFENYGSVSSGNTININATSFTNSGNVNSGNAISITAGKTISNVGKASLFALKNLTLTSPQVDNKGTLIGYQGVKIKTNKFTNSGYTPANTVIERLN